MIEIEIMHPTTNDAHLVAESLAGNQDAFRQIVERYQTLVCSLAYCATGSVSQSEDLAQETFLTAWKDLPQLREPAKLRSWLCAIVRFRISKLFRRQGREPINVAEPLEEVDMTAGPESPPSAQVITNEEAAILWRSLERVPELYREPLVLFYREHQSIETVAANLDLTEDTVKQRLSRGRKMLQEQVLAVVEGALARTSPGQAFTLGVLAAIPAMPTSAKAATLGAAAKAGAAAKSSGLLGLGGAIVAPLLALFGMWTDYRLKRKAGHSERELSVFRVYYLAIAASIAVFVVIFTILMSRGGSFMATSPALFAGLVIALVGGYALSIGAFARRFTRATKKLPADQRTAGMAAQSKSPVWEYRSRWELLGLPLIHIRFGGWFGGGIEERLQRTKKPVSAWIAITDTFAVGVLFAYGGWAIAPVSVGAFAVGLFSFGAFAVGAIAVGGFGFGIWALAPLAVGWQAFGGECAIAWDAAWSRQYAVAHHFALGEVAHAMQANNEFVRHLLNANPFFQFCIMKISSARMITMIWVWAIPMMLPQAVQGWSLARKLRQKHN
jgi:RNA polymerase sigma factor (sigma-70 family)